MNQAATTLRAQIERDIAYLRTIISEPATIRYGEKVAIEVRPDNDDDRVSVLHDQWGFTAVNYTSEGVILDVVDDAGDIIETASALSSDLITPED